MTTTITRQVARKIAAAAFAERDAFGRLQRFAVSDACEAAGVTATDPLDGADLRSVTALAAYIHANGQTVEA